MEDVVTIDGVKVAYVVEGNGEPFILIHGLGVSHHVFDPIIPGLSKYFSVYAMDLPGVGASDKPDVGYSVGYYADVLVKFMDALKIEKAALAGSSMGGMAAALVASKYPDRITKLFLIDAAGLTPIGDGRPSSMSKYVVGAMYWLSSRNKDKFMKSGEAAFYDKRHLEGPIMEDMWLQVKDKAARNALKQNVLSLMTINKGYAEALAAITVPTLIVWGKEDNALPLSDADRYNEMIKGSQVKIIEKCGHLPMVEKPNELIRAILEFMGEEDLYYSDEEKAKP